LSLSDMGMTQKVLEAEEDEMGKLTHNKIAQEGVDEFRQRTMTLLSGMADNIQRANKQTNDDPILIEYQQEGGGS